MQNKEELTDEDRATWLRLIRRAAVNEIASNDYVFVACSALKRSYREVFRRAVRSINRNTEQLGYEVRLLFVHLNVPQDIAEPLVDERARKTGHHMPVELVASQYITLQSTEFEEDCQILDAKPKGAQLCENALELISWWLQHL